MGRRSANYRRLRYIIFRPRPNEIITLEIEKQKFTPNSLAKLEIIQAYNQAEHPEGMIHFQSSSFHPMPIIKIYPLFFVKQQNTETDPKMRYMLSEEKKERSTDSAR